MSAATRERVQEIVARRHYQRRGGRRRGGIVDLVLNELDSLWSTEIIRGAEETLRAAGVSMVLSAAHGSGAGTSAWMEQLTARRSDGAVLVVAYLNLRQRTKLTSLGEPFVLVDPVGTVEAGVPTIGATDWAGAVAATEHLIGLGHRRIGMIVEKDEVSTARERRQGYESALKAAGLALDPALVVETTPDPDGGFEGMGRLLSTADRPSAVFAVNNLVALGAIEAVRNAGLEVPDDVALVCFDDIELASRLYPFLTALEQPAETFGTLGTQVLLERIQGRGPARDHVVVLPGQLTVRRSCGAQTNGAG